MIELTNPNRVKRGEALGVRAHLGPEDLQNARSISVIFENVIAHVGNSCPGNLSSWKYQVVFNGDDARMRGGNVEAIITVGRDAPISYADERLESVWWLRLKVDVPMALDKNVEKIVVVDR